MQNVNFEDDRNVIPRWRSPTVADGWEIAAARDLGNPPFTVDQFADQLALWRDEASLSAYVDIYDTGVLLSDRQLQMEGAGPILEHARLMPPALLDDVRRSMARQLDLQTRRNRLSRLERNESYLRSTIRRLKKRVIEHSRDVLAHLEIARLYVLLGQANIAERHIRTAIALAPNDRLVLRSATQYYKLVGNVIEILPDLRSSETAAWDPLIQSTEIAASNLARRQSRVAAKALRSLKGLSQVGIRRSELALAVATLEQEAGLSQRRVFQLVRAGLVQSTENAQAQAVWLGEQADRPLNSLLPNLDLSENAFEAKALAAFEDEDYVGSAHEALSWLADQPFEPDPVAVICNCYAVYLATPEKAVRIADRAIGLHSENWMVQNAILLVYIEASQFEKARRALTNLERLGTNQTVLAFALAGKGMLAFAEGDVKDGRLQYELSIAAAKRAHRPDLVFSAVAFWILAESKLRLLDEQDVLSLDKTLKGCVLRLPSQNRQYVSRLWKAVYSRSLACAGIEDSEGRALTKVRWNEVIQSLPELSGNIGAAD